eukprot:TRINITY_DN8912_c0_g1_i4.p2 TRINITY_DN8912_c0_g1~~TRINITY_DN8912_c0_g1_i4.p2  ORF type:complete len:104 (+),score=13.99 TRINITY_DN8912_c0_g1_i4:39-350(+)
MTSHQQTCDHLVKLCLAGSSTVGKSAICQMLSTGQFQKDLPSTIGVDFCIKTLNIDDRNVKMQVWDTGENVINISTPKIAVPLISQPVFSWSGAIPKHHKLLL